MNNTIKILTLLLFCIGVCSCKKELDIDYHTVTPLYVIEAYVTNEGSSAKITMTQDVMAIDSISKPVEGAVINVSSSDGSAFTLTPQGNGEYLSAEKGKAGVTYTMTAKMGDVMVTSSSTMQDSVMIDSCGFYQTDMLDNPCYIYRMYLEDDGSVLRNYYVSLYKNGKPYKWSAHQNKESFEGTLSRQIICFTDRGDDDDEDDADKKKTHIFDGDTITGFTTRIDTTSYNYYSSWELAERSNTNPLSGFSSSSSNGSAQTILGIFSAQYRTHIPTVIFKKNEIPKE